MNVQRHLPMAIAASALLAILALGDLGLDPRWGWVFKPLTTVLLAAWAWPRGSEAPAHARWVRRGLVASLGGDIALLWPAQGFVPGLLCFLVAHLCYIVGFVQRSPLARPWTPWLAYAAIAGGVMSGLWAGIPGELRGAVIVYVLCLSAMAAQAASWWLRTPLIHERRRASLAAIGGLLFVASDAMIAIDRFAQPLPHAAVWILSTYWLAQCGLVLCLAPGRRPHASDVAPTT